MWPLIMKPVPLLVPQRMFQAPPLDPPVIGLPMAMGLVEFAPLTAPSCAAVAAMSSIRLLPLYGDAAGYPKATNCSLGRWFQANPSQPTACPSVRPVVLDVPTVMAASSSVRSRLLSQALFVAAPPFQTNSPNGSKFDRFPL